MQTFLPLPNFVDSARILDRQRLGKQRVEALQILRTLQGESSGWVHHPAVKMWRGSDRGLCTYAIVICDEWICRGYKDTCRQKVIETYVEGMDRYGLIYAPSVFPPWLGDPDFHRSHQSNLIRKMPAHYRPFFPDVPNDLPYVWPEPQKVV